MPLFVLAIAGAIVYRNSFQVPFLLDDESWIVHNDHIRHLLPSWQILLRGARPLVVYSLAWNYAVSGLNIWSYHAVNLAIHIAAGLTLFGVVRRTLLTAPLRRRYGSTANWIALVISLIWMIHPIQTQAVTYVIQRSESLMSLCYLLTLYCVIRGAESFETSKPRSNSGPWSAGAVVFCMLGMLSKLVIVTAPLVVLLHDRIFFAPSLRAALRRRPGLYAGLTSTWILCIILIVGGAREFRAEVGAGVLGATPLAYALTQCGVILHYLRLALWPAPLVFDYQWPIITEFRQGLLPAAAIVLLLAAIALALRRKPRLGFLGASMILILAPTSSMIPVADVAFEYRMYLPLAAVITFVVVAVDALLNRLARHRPWALRSLAVAIVVPCVAALSQAAIGRNRQYANAVSLWKDTVAKRPTNARAYNNLGAALAREGKVHEAIAAYEEALRLDPGHVKTHGNLALALLDLGRQEEALEQFGLAAGTGTRSSQAYTKLGNALEERGRSDEALAAYEQGLHLRANDPNLYNSLGNVLTHRFKLKEAEICYAKAVELRPSFAEAHNNLGATLVQEGRFEEAVGHLQEAIRLNPHFAQAYHNLGTVFAHQEKLRDASACLSKAIALKPDDAEAYSNLANVFVQQGRLTKAISYYRTALRFQPQFAEAHNNLGRALAVQGKLPLAIEQYLEALRLNPNSVDAHNNLGVALIRQGQTQEAVREFSEAIEQNPAFVEARYNLGLALLQQGDREKARAQFSQVLSVRPDHAGARRELEQLQQ